MDGGKTAAHNLRKDPEQGYQNFLVLLLSLEMKIMIQSHTFGICTTGSDPLLTFEGHSSQAWECADGNVTSSDTTSWIIVLVMRLF